MAHIGDGNGDNEDDELLILRHKIISSASPRKKKKRQLNDSLKGENESRNVLFISRPSERPFLKVENTTGGFIVSDFLGAGGYQQILLLPATDIVHNEDKVQDKQKDMYTRKKLLECLLKRSALIDGHDILFFQPYFSSQSEKMKAVSEDLPMLIRPLLQDAHFPRYNNNENKDDSFCTKIVLPSILPSKVFDDHDVVKETIGSTSTRETKRKWQRKSFSSHAFNENNNIHCDTNRENSNSLSGKNIPQKRDNAPVPSWLKTLEKNIKKQLHSVSTSQLKQESSKEIKKLLVSQSRKILHSFISSPPPCDNIEHTSKEGEEHEEQGNEITSHSLFKLQMRRFVYKARSISTPSYSSSVNDGLSISLDFEVDLVLGSGCVQKTDYESKLGITSSRSTSTQKGGTSPYNVIFDEKKRNNVGTNIKDTSIADEDRERHMKEKMQLREVHISCSPIAHQHRDSDSENVTIRTQSGVVPLLRHNECVKVMCTVIIEGWKRNISANMVTDDALALAINAAWKTHDEDDENNERNGVILGILRLPLESFLLSLSSASHIIDFSKKNPKNVSRWCREPNLAFIPNERNLQNQNCSLSQEIPKAIFECRAPRDIFIDVSRTISNDGDYQFQEMIKCLNGTTGGNGCVNLGSNGDDSTRMKLVVWSTSPEERVGLIELVLKYLPEHCCVISENVDDDGTQLSLLRLLILCIQNEVKALKRHRTLSPEYFRTFLLNEIAHLQSVTDDTASRIKKP